MCFMNSFQLNETGRIVLIFMLFLLWVLAVILCILVNFGLENLSPLTRQFPFTPTTLFSGIYSLLWTVSTSVQAVSMSEPGVLGHILRLFVCFCEFLTSQFVL